VVQQNVRRLEVIVSDILYPDHLSVIISILEPARRKESLDLVEKFTDWELFQSLASELISSNIKILFYNEADKATRDFAASIVSAYRLSARKTKILDRKYEIHGLHPFI
jgi:hypothetical protein